MTSNFLDMGGREYSKDSDDIFAESQKPRKQEAKNLAKKLIKDVGITEAPINLRSVIAHLQQDMNLVVAARDLGELSGMIVKASDTEKETIGIGFNANEAWCRRRFTIAHEIGHLQFNTLKCDKAHSGKSPIEKECDTFAAELLMPRDILKKDLAGTPNIQELSKKYLVSQQAMSIKIMDDKLI